MDFLKLKSKHSTFRKKYPEPSGRQGAEPSPGPGPSPEPKLNPGFPDAENLRCSYVVGVSSFCGAFKKEVVGDGPEGGGAVASPNKSIRVNTHGLSVLALVILCL